MTRRFSDNDRRALTDAYHGFCANCGVEVGADGEADHVMPHSKGGKTDIANAQLLCPACNKAKGTKIQPRKMFTPRPKPALKIEPRRWQRKAAKAVVSADKKGRNLFFVSAGVGAGKSVMALLAFLQGNFDLFIVVVPKTGIRTSWADDAARMGLTIRTIEDGKRPPKLDRESGKFILPNGYILTTPLLATHARKPEFAHFNASLVHHLQALCRDAGRVLVIIDEAHHVAGEMAWKSAMRDALGEAAFHLAMSGTPYRADNQLIHALDYAARSDKLVGIPSYDYPYEEALADGHVAPIECRFVGGTVIRHLTKGGAVDVYRWSDEYLTPRGEPDLRRMGERLALSAVGCFEWQYGAIAEARKVLDEYRQDGRPWAGLVACATVEQAEKIAAHITDRYGDRCKLIVGDVGTEAAVDEVNADTSIKWVVSITKISEGVSIKRLRVGVLLSNFTTRAYLDQLKGRLSRLYDSIPSIEQPCTFFMPADPRNIEFANQSNQTLLHMVPWLREREKGESRATYAEAIVRERDALADEPQITGMTAAELKQYIKAEAAKITQLRRQVTTRPPIIDLGEVKLYGTAQLDGAVVDGQYYTEDEWQALREEMIARGINPFRSKHYTAAQLKALKDI